MRIRQFLPDSRNFMSVIVDATIKLEARARQWEVSCLKSMTRRVPGLSIGVVIATAVTVLAGWALGVPAMTTILPHAIPMTAFTSFLFLVAAVGLWMVSRETGLVVCRPCAYFCGSTCIIAGMYRLADYVFGFPIHIDEIFASVPVARDAVGPHLPLVAAFCFVVLGSAILLIAHSNSVWMAQLIACPVAVIGLVGILGYVASSLSSGGGNFPEFMPVHAAVCMVLLCAGLLHVRSNQGIMATVTNRGLGGVMARRLIPVVVVLPLLLFVFLELQTSLDRHLGNAIVVTLNISALCMLIWWNADALCRLDAERKTAETAVRESEERFRAIFEQAAVGIVIAAPNGRFLSANGALCGMLGYSQEELLLKTFMDITDPDDLEATRRSSQQALAGEISMYSLEKRYVRKDGQPVWVITAVSVVRDSTGQPKYFIAAIQDVSARHRAQQKSARLLDQRDEFLRVATHDLKGPLSVLLGAANLLETMGPPGSPLRADSHELVRLIGKQTRTMLRIVEDFLDARAIEDGRIKLKVEPVELNELAAAAVDSQQNHAAAKGIALSFKPSAAPAYIMADPARVQQVVQNLVDNAVKFTPMGGRVIVRNLVDTGRVTFEVCDSGPGLRDSDIDNAFKRDAVKKNRPTGGEHSSGLGLSICQQLIALHGGQIAVRNNPYGGSTFFFSLPRLRNSRDESDDYTGKALATSR
ncbi:MAG: PAS domain S-box protein [Candidatus Sumerlaeaceae bacterium]|nr:PAS domain S-box protein [Candidatus Sumerlaeaceae bacterium]